MAVGSGAGTDFYAPLGVTPPACLPVQHGHRDSPLAWRPSERKFPPRSPAFRTFGGGALSAFQKVAPDAVPFGPGLPQGHGGWNQGAGARSNHPLGAVAGVRPLWAGGSGQGSPWDILGAMPACPGPPVRPETAPSARGPGRGIRLGEGKHGLAPSSPSDVVRLPRGDEASEQLSISRIKMACWVVCLDGPLPPSRM